MRRGKKVFFLNDVLAKVDRHVLSSYNAPGVRLFICTVAQLRNKISHVLDCGGRTSLLHHSSPSSLRLFLSPASPPPPEMTSKINALPNYMT